MSRGRIEGLLLWKGLWTKQKEASREFVWGGPGGLSAQILATGFITPTMDPETACLQAWASSDGEGRVRREERERKDRGRRQREDEKRRESVGLFTS